LFSGCATTHDTQVFKGVVVAKWAQHSNQRMTPVPMPGGGYITVPIGEPASYSYLLRNAATKTVNVNSREVFEIGAYLAVFVGAERGLAASYPVAHATLRPAEGC
jgi:hypothetical protein